MAKVKTQFVCNACGFTAPRWTGQCPACGAWNCMEEQTTDVRSGGGSSTAPSRRAEILDLASVSPQSEKRVSSGIGEFDRVLGGGIVQGAVVLAGGEPGIGKSTLFLQAAGHLLKHGTVLYVSGEESPSQIRMRADRLEVPDGVKVMAETEISAIADGIREMQPGFLIIDSIQTLYDQELSSAPGSVTQVRGCASRLARIAKATGMPTFIIGHVTKEGAIAGPRVLEHIVDTVLYFEGERSSDLRILRAVKNRFGGTDEIGLFEMRGTGMHEVQDPGLFLERFDGRGLDGVAVFPATQGARPMLLEIQALCSHTQLNVPRRLSSGIDSNRLYMICAILEKKIGLRLYTEDVFVNVAGGIRVKEYASDLALAVAIVSSLRAVPIRANTAFIGEIGLSGELRPVGNMLRRLSECARLGIERVVIPKGRKRGKVPDGIELVECPTLFDVFEKTF